MRGVHAQGLLCTPRGPQDIAQTSGLAQIAAERGTSVSSLRDPETLLPFVGLRAPRARERASRGHDRGAQPRPAAAHFPPLPPATQTTSPPHASLLPGITALQAGHPDERTSGGEAVASRGAVCVAFHIDEGAVDGRNFVCRWPGALADTDIGHMPSVVEDGCGDIAAVGAAHWEAIDPGQMDLESWRVPPAAGALQAVPRPCAKLALAPLIGADELPSLVLEVAHPLHGLDKHRSALVARCLTTENDGRTYGGTCAYRRTRLLPLEALPLPPISGVVWQKVALIEQARATLLACVLPLCQLPGTCRRASAPT
mmetsp:Transcript_10303/g.29770  ORF Transcript_10303/g.29770 Transcript_10303/m.29770 type:complete len:313 (-) Transcript_10303:646-1584(-)